MTEESKDKKDKDIQSRGWMLTIPAENHDWDSVQRLMLGLAPVSVFQEESGARTGYRHYQAYIQLPSPRRWSTMKNMLRKAGFDDAHFEPQWASAAACYKYCTKEDTKLRGPQINGVVDMHENQGQRTDLDRLKRLVLEDGLTYDELLAREDVGNVARYRNMLRDLEGVRDSRALDSQAWRHVEVNYLYGPTGVGKTRYVFERYQPGEFYRITNYSNPWDRYKGQHVVVFDEFAGQPTIEEMLDWLDSYTTQLRARYADKVSRYDTVWVLSNLSLAEQYSYKPSEQRAAFRRRFTHIYSMDRPGILTEELHADTIEEAISKLGL